MSHQQLSFDAYQEFGVEFSPQIAAAIDELSLSTETKLRGAVFTRPEVVAFILDLAGYTVDRPLHRQRLLEPSFGGGDFLLPVVKRLLAAWNHWDGKLGGSEDFLVREAVKLTVAEFDRGVDHARIDAYRKVEKARKLEPLKLYFAYLKNRKFDVEAIEERLEADTAAPPALAAPFGKRWMAMRLAELERQEAAGRAVWRATSFQRAMAAQPDKAHIVADDRRRGEFPLVARMDEHAGNGRSWPLTPDLPPSEHFVQIAADSDECRAWAGWHAARDWPWPSLPAWADYIWVPSRLPPALPEDVLSETGVL